jgi:O-acetyl-ADP-ribose deacetylase (regulator of RNase III)
MAPGSQKRYYYNNKLLELVQTDLLSYKAEALVIPIDKDFSFDPDGVYAHKQLGKAGGAVFEEATSLPKASRIDRLSGSPDESMYTLATRGLLPHHYLICCVTARYLRVSRGPITQVQSSCTTEGIGYSTKKALNLAKEKGAASIAFPALGTEYELPLKESVEAVGNQIINHLKLPDCIPRIGLIISPEQDYAIAEGVLDELSGSLKNPVLVRKKAT